MKKKTFQQIMLGATCSKKYLLVLLLFILVHSSYAQVDAGLENLRTVVPPSPNASSLGKFGEWPVSLYTGVPNISIPIYQLKGRSLSVPISINYHSSGIRVGEIASWVGLGWALNAGGCISRTVQGLPDEQGYFVTASNFQNKNDFTSPDKSDNILNMTIGAAVQGQTDTQQDIYNLNVLGKSYRIYLKGDTTAYTIPYSNIKILTNFLTSIDSSWKMILEDGTQLVFGGSTSSNNIYSELTANTRFGGNFISAWYLQSITATSGETIQFRYTSTTVNQDTHFSQSDKISYFTNAIVSSNNTVTPFINVGGTSSHTELQTVTQLCLNTIESDLAKLYFIPSSSQRKDLAGGVSLSEIKIFSKLTNNYIEDWSFNYSYSRSVPGNELLGNSGTGLDGTDTSYYHYRLKLMGLTRNATDTTQSQSWQLSYNPLGLPSRRSFAQDHWGFYNGANSNISLLPVVGFDPRLCGLAVSNYPKYSFVNIGFMPGLHDLGAIRNSNEVSMQAETLTQIQYPTGGYSIFNYEANSKTINQEIFGDTTVNLNIYLTAGLTKYIDTIDFHFIITKPEYINLSLGGSISQTVISDFPGAKVYAIIIDSLGNTVCTGIINSSAWFNLYGAGSYTFRLYSNVTSANFSSNNDFVNAYASLRFFPSHGVQNTWQFLGGLRINNIQQYDGISITPVDTKYFTYDSAFVINPVDSVNDYLTTQSIIKPVNTDGSQFQYNQLTRNSSTKFSLGSIQGGTVGYGKVTTYDGRNANNGYTISKFSFDSTSIAFLPAARTFPYAPDDLLDWRNGLLMSETIYTSFGQPVKATRNNYQFISKGKLVNFKVGYTTINAPLTCVSAVYGGCGAYVLDYSITNEQVQHISSSQVVYNPTKGDSLTTTTTYYYDDTLNTQPIRTLSLNSKGDTILIYSRTALEKAAINNSISLSPIASQAIDSMLARNMVAIPLQTEKYTKGQLISKTLTNYKLQTNGLLLADNVMLQKGNNSLETRVYFPKYDNYGNLLEQFKLSDVKHDYIWDYAHNYPIAEVINGDSSSIAYTSFEADGSGNWAISSSQRDSITPTITGNLSYNLGNGTITNGILLTNTRSYIISYWSNHGSYSITGTSNLKQGRSATINGVQWTYYEHSISGVSSVTISGSGNIDELRLFPQGAQMTTSTFLPLIGISSQCDVNNHIQYFEYDGLNRLKAIRDQDRNIIKTYEYQYKAMQ